MSVYLEYRQALRDWLILVFVVGTTDTDVHLQFSSLDPEPLGFSPPQKGVASLGRSSKWKFGTG